MSEEEDINWILEYFELHSVMDFVSDFQIRHAASTKHNILKKRVTKLAAKLADHIADHLTVTQNRTTKPDKGEELRTETYTISRDGLKDLVKEIKRRTHR